MALRILYDDDVWMHEQKAYAEIAEALVSNFPAWDDDNYNSILIFNPKPTYDTDQWYGLDMLFITNRYIKIFELKKNSSSSRKLVLPKEDHWYDKAWKIGKKNISTRAKSKNPFVQVSRHKSQLVSYLNQYKEKWSEDTIIDKNAPISIVLFERKMNFNKNSIPKSFRYNFFIENLEEKSFLNHFRDYNSTQVTFVPSINLSNEEVDKISQLFQTKPYKTNKLLISEQLDLEKPEVQNAICEIYKSCESIDNIVDLYSFSGIEDSLLREKIELIISQNNLISDSKDSIDDFDSSKKKNKLSKKSRLNLGDFKKHLEDTKPTPKSISNSPSKSVDLSIFKDLLHQSQSSQPKINKSANKINLADFKKRVNDRVSLMNQIAYDHRVSKIKIPKFRSTPPIKPKPLLQKPKKQLKLIGDSFTDINFQYNFIVNSFNCHSLGPYYSVRKYQNNLSFNDIESRQEIWKFKDGDDCVAEKISSDVSSAIYNLNPFDIRHENETLLVCIPASTEVKNQNRFRRPCSLISNSLMIDNGFNYIKITEDRKAVHLGGSGANNLYFDRRIANYKNVIILDDILTSGSSFISLSNQIKSLGVNNIIGIFIGKTQ
jgi:hypothetical protein